MKDFASFMDLTGEGRNLRCQYHGSNNLHLEARIFSENESLLNVGVSLWKDDIASHKYDPNRNSLDIWYQKPPQDTIRHMGLVIERFDVPKDIKEINVYDKGQNS